MGLFLWYVRKTTMETQGDVLAFCLLLTGLKAGDVLKTVSPSEHGSEILTYLLP